MWFEVRCGLAGTHMHACMHKRKHARARARMRLLHPWATDTHFLDARQRQLVVLELQDRGAGVQVGHLRELLLPACLPRGEEGVGGSGGRVAAPSPSIGAALAWGLRACVLLSDLHAHSAPPLTRTPRSGPLPSLSSLAEPVGLASRGLPKKQLLVKISSGERCTKVPSNPRLAHAPKSNSLQSYSRPPPPQHAADPALPLRRAVEVAVRAQQVPLTRQLILHLREVDDAHHLRTHGRVEEGSGEAQPKDVEGRERAKPREVWCGAQDITRACCERNGRRGAPGSCRPPRLQPLQPWPSSRCTPAPAAACAARTCWWPRPSRAQLREQEGGVLGLYVLNKGDEKQGCSRCKRV